MSRILHLNSGQVARSMRNPMLFAALAPATQEKLRSTAIARRFASGALIQQKGDEALGFWLIEEGAVAVGRFLDGGEFLAMGLLGPGDSYGELAVLAGRRRVADAVARSAARVRFITAASFESALADDPGSMRTLLGGLALQLQEALDRVASIRRGTATARTAAMLANLAESGGDAQRVAVTQQDIADLLGVTRATANAALRELEDAGLIRRGYGAIEVPDPVRLRRAMRR